MAGQSIRITDLEKHDADWTSVTSPPVTVIRQPVYQLGEAAAKLLIERLNGNRTTARNVVLQTQIVERASVARTQ